MALKPYICKIKTKNVKTQPDARVGVPKGILASKHMEIWNKIKENKKSLGIGALVGAVVTGTIDYVRNRKTSDRLKAVEAELEKLKAAAAEKTEKTSEKKDDGKTETNKEEKKTEKK